MTRHTTICCTLIVLALTLTSAVPFQNSNNSFAGPVVFQPASNCGCKKCRSRKRCRKCPKCQNDVCSLKAECVKEKKTCFEVEQKLICIPKVSLPWRKCKKPCGGNCAGNCRHKCGKTKTVNVLKTKSYECEVCKYSWKVYEPQEQKPADTNTDDQPTAEPQDESPAEPQYNDSELYDPTGNDVPKAPTMNGARALLNRNSSTRR